MKTIRFIALALAILTASSFVACGGDDGETTTAASTTAAAVTTKAPDTEKPPVDEDPGPETPDTSPDSVAALLAGPTLQSLVTDVTGTGLTFWGDGAAANAFDGDLAGTKLGGGDFNGNAVITWKTSVETTVDYYAVVTGGDSGQYGRVPKAWTFSGSADGETWTVIDKVTDSSIVNSDAKPFIYYVDESAAYTNYKLEITAVGPDDSGATTAVQFNEFVLIGEGAEDAAAETPVVDETAIADMLASGTKIEVVEPASPNMGLWGDGAVINAFDGTALPAEDGTNPAKLGGGSAADLATLTWSTATPTTVKNYVLYTCWDCDGTASGWGRTPISWALFGSNDGENWEALDIVANSGMENINNKPYGFTIDKPAAYTQYTMVFTSALDQNNVVLTDSYALSLNEIVLIGDVAAAE